MSYAAPLGRRLQYTRRQTLPRAGWNAPCLAGCCASLGRGPLVTCGPSKTPECDLHDEVVAYLDDSKIGATEP